MSLVTKIIDLSQEIFQGMYVYPGHLKTVVWDHHHHWETAKNFDSEMSYASKGLLLSDHGPTHVDAISHLDPREGAPSIDQMDLSLFHGRAVCLDISHKKPKSYVSDADLDEAVASSGASWSEGDVLLLHTGTYERYQGTADYLSEYPGLDESASNWIVDKGFKIFGVDSPSPDNPTSRTYPCHMMCRERGMSHYENLMNLGQLVGERFTFVGFPLRIRGGTGSPIRAVALLDE